MASLVPPLLVGGTIGATGLYLWKSWRFPSISTTNEKKPYLKVEQINPKLIRATIDFKNKHLNDNIMNINFPEIQKEFVIDRKMKMTNGTHEIDYEVKEGQTITKFLSALYKGSATIEYYTFNSWNPFAQIKDVRENVYLV